MRSDLDLSFCENKKRSEGTGTWAEIRSLERGIDNVGRGERKLKIRVGGGVCCVFFFFFSHSVQQVYHYQKPF